MQSFKKFLELSLSIIFTALAEFMMWLKLEWLQKIYYSLASILMFIAIWKLLLNQKLKVEKISQPASIVDQASEPIKKAKQFISMTKKLKKGVKNMFIKIKAFGLLRLVAIILEILFLILGVASIYIPELIWIQENVIGLFTAMGITGVAAAWAQGKELGKEAKKREELKLRKCEIKIENKRINTALFALDNQYAYLAPLKDAIIISGAGELTTLDKESDNIYMAQRNGLLSKLKVIADEELEIDIKLKGKGGLNDD